MLINNIYMIDSDILPDNIYYDVNITSETQPDKRASITQFLTNPLITKPVNYYLTVARMYIPVGSVPLMSQFPIKSGQTQTNPNLSSLSVTMFYNGNYTTETNILWVSNNGVPAPNPPSMNPPSYGPIPSPYYFVYDYEAFIFCVNNAIATAFLTLPGLPGGALPPYLIYDSATKLFSIVAQVAHYDILTNPNPIKLYFNNELYTFFLGISAIKQQNSVLGRDFLINIYDTFNNLYNPPQAAPVYPPPYYIVTQQYTNLNAFNDLLGISVESNTLPVLMQVSQVKNSGVSINRPVLTNFNMLYSNDEPRSAIQYFANLYRLIDLFGTDPLQKIDITVQYYTKNYNYYPLYLDTNDTLSIKLLFVKKSLYKEITYKDDVNEKIKSEDREREREHAELLGTNGKGIRLQRYLLNNRMQ